MQFNQFLCNLHVYSQWSCTIHAFNHRPLPHTTHSHAFDILLCPRAAKINAKRKCTNLSAKRPVAVQHNDNHKTNIKISLLGRDDDDGDDVEWSMVNADAQALGVNGQLLISIKCTVNMTVKNPMTSTSKPIFGGRLRFSGFLHVKWLRPMTVFCRATCLSVCVCVRAMKSGIVRDLQKCSHIDHIRCAVEVYSHSRVDMDNHIAIRRYSTQM